MQSNVIKIPNTKVNDPIDIGLGLKGRKSLLLQEMSNPHILMAGKSGSGKSHTIKNLVAQLNDRGLTIHILELHPDYSPDEFKKTVVDSSISLNNSRFNYMNFDYVEGDASINPLQFNPSPQSGGVYMAIQDFIDIVRLFNPTLGSKQFSYLQRIVAEVYKLKGIHHEDPRSWVFESGTNLSTNHHPSLFDIREMLSNIMLSLASGLDDSLVAQMKKLKNKSNTLSSRLRNMTLETEHQQAALSAELEDTVSQLQEKAALMIHASVYGQSVESFYSGWKIDTLESIKDTIDSMIGSTLFTRNLHSPQTGPKRGKINIYRLSNLNYQHQKTLIHLLLLRLYNASMRMCSQINPKVPDTYIVLDEGRYAQDAAKTAMSPLNVIFGGSRKFGLGMIVGVQGVNQLSKDMIDNFSGKFILASSESSYSDAKKYFGLTPPLMQKIVPRRDGLFSVDQSPFEMVRLFAP